MCWRLKKFHLKSRRCVCWPVLDSKHAGVAPVLRLPADTSKLAELRELAVSTPEMPQFLGRLPNLQYLALDQTTITQTAVAGLSSLTMLTGGSTP